MGDVKECRDKAERCEQLARDATNDNFRKAFVGIAARWRWLAAEIEAETEHQQSDRTELPDRA